MSARFLTPVGVRCTKHGTHALADEPCWRCESDRSDVRRRLHDALRARTSLARELRDLIACTHVRHNPAHEPARRPR